MTLLSKADMVYLRAEAENLLPDTCAIQERQTIADDYGGFTESWATSYQGVPCRLSEMQRVQGEGTQGTRESGDTSWVFTLPHDQAISRDDRVVHGGVTYEVTFINEGRSYDTVRRVALRRLD